MMKLKIVLLFLGLILTRGFIAREEAQIDSLLQEIQTMSDDTNKVNALNELFLLTWEVKYADNALELSKNVGWKIGEIRSKENLGSFYSYYNEMEKSLVLYNSCLEYYESVENLNKVAEINQALAYAHYPGDYIKAIDYFFRASQFFKELDEREKEGSCYNMMGHSYKRLYNYSTALEYYIKYLKIAEEIGVKSDIQIGLKNVGTIYEYQKDYKQALDYYLKSVNVAEEMGGIDSTKWVFYYDHVGNVYRKMKDFDHALEFYMKSLKAYEEQQYGIRTIEDIDYLGNIAESYQNLGDLSFDQKKYQEANEYYLKSLEIYQGTYIECSNWELLNDLAKVFLIEKDYSQAKKYASQSLIGANKEGSIIDIRDASEILYQIFAIEGNYQEALEMNILFISMRDSLNNDEMYKESLQQTFAYENEKKYFADSLKSVEQEKVHIANLEAEKAKNEQQEIQLSSQKKQAFFLYFGLGLVGLFGVFIFNRFKVTQKQNKIIESQKQEVEKAHSELENTHFQLEESHREITDSINYAERIQRSFLATKEILDENLKDYFVFFKPKEAVSGDFYWAAELKNGNFAWSCADSTGHGVPGAIMSLLNISSLEKSIETETSPEKILVKTREIIINRLKKDGSEEGGKDGMDCNLLVINKERSQLTFASAHNPVIIVRGGELIEFKGDKIPVGKHDRDNESFTLQTLQLQKGDVIYALTDGFPDQFGGPKGKKYMIKNLKNKFIEIAGFPMNEQQIILNKEFEDWKQTNEQIDDVCIIGVRV